LNIYESIPGIAKTTAVRLVAELGDLRRFDTSAQIDAFVGIDLIRITESAQVSKLSQNSNCSNLRKARYVSKISKSLLGKPLAIFTI
jgi:hypothetical protein